MPCPPTARPASTDAAISSSSKLAGVSLPGDVAVQVRAPAARRLLYSCVSVSEIAVVLMPWSSRLVQIPIRWFRNSFWCPRFMPFHSSSAGKAKKSSPSGGFAGSMRSWRRSAAVRPSCGGDTAVSIWSGAKWLSMWFTWSVVDGLASGCVVASWKMPAGCRLYAPKDGKSWPGGAASAQSVEPPEGTLGSIENG
jgi:hypothetical protein